MTDDAFKRQLTPDEALSELETLSANVATGHAGGGQIWHDIDWLDETDDLFTIHVVHKEGGNGRVEIMNLPFDGLSFSAEGLDEFLYALWLARHLLTEDAP